ncbi:MAG TPA: sugar-binding protein [Bacillales bacterium]|nr:sugar-binding protein [Bacillales bacterium]
MRLHRWIYLSLVSMLVLSLSFTIYFMIRGLQFDSHLTKASDFHRPRYHFVLIPEEMNNPYWRLVEKGADAAAAKYDAVVEYNGPVQSNINEHKKVMREAIASKVDGIITQGLSESETTVINKAIQQGIPVVTVDTDMPDSRRIAYVGTDNYAAGVRAGKFLVKATGGHAKVGIVTGSLGASGQQLRVKGFRDAVKKAPGIEIVAVEPSHITRVQAAEKTYEIFKNHPDVTAFFGTSALDGIGIAATVQSLGKTKDVFILSFDTLPDTLKLMKKGKIGATVAQEPYEMGYKSVELMVNIANGKNVDGSNLTPTKIILPSELPLAVPYSGKAGDIR